MYSYHCPAFCSTGKRMCINPIPISLELPILIFSPRFKQKKQNISPDLELTITKARFRNIRNRFKKLKLFQTSSTMTNNIPSTLVLICLHLFKCRQI